MAFGLDPDEKFQLFQTSGAVQSLLGQPGLGNDTSLQLKDELAERRKRLMGGASDPNQNDYGAGLLRGAASSLFGTTR